MSLEGLLYASLPFGLIVSLAVSVILVSAALRGAFIAALVERAILSVLISFTLLVYVLAVQNSTLGYPIPREYAQIALRLLFVAFVLLQCWWLYLFLSNGFHDGGEAQ